MRSWLTGLLITVVWFPTLIWASPQAKITDIKWLEGNWIGTRGEFPMEAHYTSARGGLILGLTKIASDERLDFFEFETFQEVDGKLQLQPYPFGQQGVAFEAIEVGAQRVVFENPTHDFPKRIIYEWKSDGTLLARIEGNQDGQEIAEDLVFQRAK